MSLDLRKILKNKAVNGWRLFWLVSIPMSVAIVIKMMMVDLSTAPGVSQMISFSVRWAVPIIFLIVATSSLQILFTGPIPSWLLRNRKYVGMCFAVAMAWQGAFIFTMSNVFRDYYFENVYFFRDELEGTTGYIFLAAMVVTSFEFGRKRLTVKQWKLLHTSSVYFLFAYPFSVYWWNLFYYENPRPIDHVFYWIGFVAFTLRIAAWGKRRRQATSRMTSVDDTPIGMKLLGAGFMALGLFVAATGLQWQEAVTAFLTAPGWSANLELWLPFWPFEPFLSLLIIGFGAMLFTQARATGDRFDEVASRP